MPILTMQKQLRRLGKIRMGEQRVSTKGKSYPAKLETWRLTSPTIEYVEHAAALYGGEVSEWKDAPGEGRQFEVVTTADTLDVMIPPGEMAFSQWFETWSAGGCQRRCDGETETLSGEACMCSPDPEQRECKATTRLSVILPRLPDAGIWMLESHGYYAAAELGATIEILRLAAATARPVPANLRMEPRTVKRGGETRNYVVPVIELQGMTIGTLMTGESPTQIAPASTTAPALGPGGGDGVTLPPSQGAVSGPRRSEPTSPTDLPPFPEDVAPHVRLATEDERNELWTWLGELDADTRAAVSDAWKDEVGMTLKSPERFTLDHYVKACDLITKTVGEALTA